MRYAVIPTRGRPEVALTCIESIRPQVDIVYVIDNADRSQQRVPPPSPELRRNHANYYTIHIPAKKDVPNLSYLWNVGINLSRVNATDKGLETWEVAILNDDTIVPTDWFGSVALAMRDEGAAAGCSGPTSILHRSPGPIPLATRMTGWGFILAGEKLLIADEELHWWYGDDDLDWQARQAGGMIMVAGLPVQHLSADQNTVKPAFQARAALDREHFLQKWGKLPW